MGPGLEQDRELQDGAATARVAIEAWETEDVNFHRQTTRQVVFTIKAADDRVALGKPIAGRDGRGGRGRAQLHAKAVSIGEEGELAELSRCGQGEPEGATNNGD